jgi:catecholate siderophore receptor
MTFARKAEKSLGSSLFDDAASDLTPIETAQRSDHATTRILTALCVLAASPAGVAMAQDGSQAAEPADLPPLVVETTQQKKKSATAKKKAVPTSPAPQPLPAVEQSADRPQTPPLPGRAGPVAPGQYKADYVTSNKITGPLLDTPQTVTVIPGTIIKERGATSLTEALRNTPGITFNAGENGFTTSIDNFSLRGFDTSGSIFSDGVRNNGSFARDMFNVEQVEVYKGVSSDNGRGGPGGYINLVTKTPQEENFVRGRSFVALDEYGTDPLFRSEIDVNQRIGTVGVRMNGMYENGGVMGRDIAELDAYGLAPSITFGLGTDVRATFAYERLDRNDVPDGGVHAQIVPGTSRYNPAFGAISRDTFYGLRTDFDKVETDAVLARLEYDISPFFTISNQTRWAQADRSARVVQPFQVNGNVSDVNQTDYNRENTSISNMTNLAGTFVAGGFKHTISTGIELSREESDAPRRGEINNAAQDTDIFNPDPGRHPGFPFIAAERSSVEIDTVAVYFYDTIQLTRKLDLVGGLRAEHYRVEFASKTLPAGTPAPDGLDGYENFETTLGGKIGLVYKPVPEGSLYATYGASVLPPGSFLSNTDISRSGANGFQSFIPGADPVEMDHFEVGVKWDFFGGRLSTTAAAFYTEKSKVPHGNAANLVYGEQVVKGIEFGIAGSITERWKAFGGLLLLDSERKHGADVDAASAGDYGVGSGAATAIPGYAPVLSTNGDELAFTPNFSATLWMTYDVTDKFTLGGGVQYVGESWIGRPDDALRIIPNGKFGELPDYFLVNFMASYDLTDSIDLQFNIDNLFDEEYAISSNWPGQRVTLGPPRTFRLGTSFDF